MLSTMKARLQKTSSWRVFNHSQSAGCSWRLTYRLRDSDFLKDGSVGKLSVRKLDGVLAKLDGTLARSSDLSSDDTTWAIRGTLPNSANVPHVDTVQRRIDINLVDMRWGIISLAFSFSIKTNLHSLMKFCAVILQFLPSGREQVSSSTSIKTRF